MKKLLGHDEEVSLAIKRLREEMRLTQQEFAYRLGVAIRTIARWERNQSPHGDALIKLAQLADSRELKQVADCFVAALRREETSHYASSEPELKAWSEGLEIAFRFRLKGSGQKAWLQIAERITAVVFLAAHEDEEVGDQKSQEFYYLHRQLEGALDQYRPERPN